MLAPNAPLRSAATAYGRDEANQHAEPKPGQASSPAAPAASLCSPARYLWATLRARLFESLPLVCPHCGADMRIVAFVTEAVPVERILTHIGEPAKPPPTDSASTGLARRPHRGYPHLLSRLGRLDFFL